MAAEHAGGIPSESGPHSSAPPPDGEQVLLHNEHHSHNAFINPQGHHGHRRGHRFREFFLPNGRKVRVASTPEEHDELKRQISDVEKSRDVDVLIHGSPEHLQAIQELHAHHQSRRDSLRSKHGNIYDEFEKVKEDLDALATELHIITDQGVSLDANFNKYGYSAHVRTKDNSSASTLSSSSHALDHDRDTAPMKFARRPVVRQYFHKGLLWRSSRSGEVASFELFSDLLYVGIIEIVGEAASETASGVGFLHFIITFIITWKIWTDLTNIVNWFEVDDVLSRVMVLVYLVCLLGFTTNIIYAFETTYTPMIAFYIAERIFQGLYFLGVAYLVPTIRGSMYCQSISIFVTCALWITSIHVEWPDQLLPIFIALFLDLFGYFIFIVFFRWGQTKAMAQTRGLAFSICTGVHKMFEFIPAINIEHRIERTNAFVTLVFGSSVLAIIYQNHHASSALSAFFGKSCLALIQAASFNWMYFEIDSIRCHVHAIRRHYISALLWQSAHIPFIMGYVLAAAAMSKLVLAHDSSNANPESLGEEYILESESEVAAFLRWYYCGGLSVALFSMATISICHIHKKVTGARIKKNTRLLARCCVALIICLLPLTSPSHLSSLSLMSITSSLVILSLAVDVYGTTSVNNAFFTGGFNDAEKKKCQYEASCQMTKRQRREIDKKMKRGEKVTIEDILKGPFSCGKERKTSTSSTGETLQSSATSSSDDLAASSPMATEIVMHSHV